MKILTLFGFLTLFSLGLGAQVITAPSAGAVMDNGCYYNSSDRFDPTIWNFAWTPVTGATQYQLQVLLSGGGVYLDRTVTTTTYTYTQNEFTIASPLTGYSVKVRALVGGSYLPFSPPVTFDVEPENTDCPPTITSPAAGAILDNGCISGTDPQVWDFAWTGNATQRYNINVRNRNSPYAIINNNVVGNSFHFMQTYYGADDIYLYGWEVKVRTLDAAGNPGPWGPTFTFDLEPNNTDCPPPPAPTITSPTAGAVLDNGCSDGSNGTNWNFSWTPVTDATDYNLRIFQNGALRASLSSATNSLNYNRANFFYNAANTTGWTVSVNATVGGISGPFSTPVPFSIEPVNTDCPGCATPPAPSVSYNPTTSLTTVSWPNNPANTFGYYIVYRPVGGAYATYAVPASTAALVSQTLPAGTLMVGTTYEFSIVPRCSASSNGTISAVTTFSIPCASVAAPTLSYDPATNTTYVRWNNTPAATAGYYLQYRIIGTSSFATLTIPINGSTVSAVGLNLVVGQAYEFRVFPRCTPTTNGPPTALVSLAIPCPSVSGTPTVVYNSSQFSATVSWPSVAGVTSYKMEYRLASSTGEWRSVVVSTNTATVGELIAGLAYTFRVSVVCSGSLGETSPVGTFEVPCLNIPDGQVQDITPTSATLKWETSGANFYNVYSEEGDVVTSDPTILTLKDLLPDNTYTYRIAPNCNQDQENSGLKLTFTTPPSPTPIQCLAPTGVTLTKIKSTSATVAWVKSASARRYKVNYKLSSETEWKTITTSKTSVTLEGLTARDLGDGKYDVQVMSVCSPTSWSDASAVVSFQTKSTCPEIDALTVPYTSFTMASLVWDEESLAANGFVAEYSLSPFDADNAKSKASTTNKMVISGLEPNKNYVVRIKSQCSEVALSQFSNEVFFSTPPIVCGAPIKLKAFNITPNSATVTWGNVPVANNYEMAYKKADDTEWTTVMSTNPGANLTELSPETVYNTRVKSLCPFDNQSGWSTVGNFTTAAVAVVATTTLFTENTEGAFKNKQAKAFDVSISPNPTKGEIQLDVDTDKEQSLDVELTNRLGQVVLRKKFDNIAKGHTTLSLDLTNLPSDIYMVRSFNGQAYKTNKVVIIH